MVITACGKIKPDSICKFLFFYHLLRQPPSARDPTNIMPTTAVVAHAAAAPVAPFPPVAAAAAVAAATGVAVPSRDAALAALNAADNTTVRKFLHNRLKTRRSAPFPVAAPRADKLHVAELDLRTELKVNRAKTLSKAQWQTAFPKTRRDPFAAVIHAGRALSAIVRGDLQQAICAANGFEFSYFSTRADFMHFDSTINAPYRSHCMHACDFSSRAKMKI